MYQTENYKYNKAFIIGNGFDKANGFPTGYGDFVESPNFKNLLSHDNQLAKFIKNTYDDAKWVDIEIEIGKYSCNLGEVYKGNSFAKETEKFRNDYIKLTDALYWYIDGIRSGKINSRMEDLVKSWKNSLFGKVQEQAFFVTFNYMRWDVTILQEKMRNDRFINYYPLSIHGVTQYDANATPKIVLGVDEKSIYCKEHKFIVKAYNPYCEADAYFRHIYDANQIIIFGCSIGNTDQRYFSHLFSQAKGKTFNIYCYGNEDIIETKANISTICDFDKFVGENDVKFEDSTEFPN